MSISDGNISGDNGGGSVNAPLGNGSDERTPIRPSGITARRGAPVTVAPAAIGHNPNAEPDTGSDTGSGDSPRRRGRPRGSRNSNTRSPDASLDLSGIQAALTSAHLVLSVITKNEKWMLSETEAKSLADAVRNATRHHDVAVAQKTVDYINLAIVAGMVYGTRIIAIQRERRATPKPTAQSNVTDAEMSHAAGGGNVSRFPMQ